MFAVAMNELGGLQRLDALYISYSFTSSAMMITSAQNLSVLITGDQVDM